MELDMKDYLKIMRKRMWMIGAIIFVSVIATAVVSYFYLTPVYEASTKLIVNKSSDQTDASPIDINSVNLNLRLIDTYKEVIKTPRIMDKVVSDYPEIGLTSEELSKKVQVSSVNDTQVMTLIVQDPSYDKAAVIVNAVSKVFESEIPSIMKVDNVSLLNQAKPMDKPVPVKPNPKLNIAIGFVVSLMLGMGIAFLLEFLDDSITTEDDVEEYLSLPTLALITRTREEDFQNHGSKVQEASGGEVKHVTINQ